MTVWLFAKGLTVVTGRGQRTDTTYAAFSFCISVLKIIIHVCTIKSFVKKKLKKNYYGYTDIMLIIRDKVHQMSRSKYVQRDDNARA